MIRASARPSSRFGRGFWIVSAKHALFFPCLVVFVLVLRRKPTKDSHDVGSLHKRLTLHAERLRLRESWVLVYVVYVAKPVRQQKRVHFRRQCRRQFGRELWVPDPDHNIEFHHQPLAQHANALGDVNVVDFRRVVRTFHA